MGITLGSSANVEAALLALPMELQRVAATLEAGLSSFQNGLRVDGHKYLPAGGRALAQAGSGRLVGWSVRATGGPVTLNVRDSRSADAGDVIATVALADGASSTHAIGVPGVAFVEGLFLERTGVGSLEGSVWIGAVD